METPSKATKIFSRPLASLATAFLAGCATPAIHPGEKVYLTGAQEVPPVSTPATGTGYIRVRDDGSVSGSITTSGITSTAGHIHMGATGKNGPVIVPLTKTSDNIYAVPAGAALTDAQLSGYQAGNLYVNIHSAAHPGGEIRAQISPVPGRPPGGYAMD